MYMITHTYEYEYIHRRTRRCASGHSILLCARVFVYGFVLVVYECVFSFDMHTGNVSPALLILGPRRGGLFLRLPPGLSLNRNYQTIVRAVLLGSVI